MTGIRHYKNQMITLHYPHGMIPFPSPTLPHFTSITVLIPKT
jgi:hypothetical protein